MSPRPPRPPTIRYRPARRTDVETLAELAARTYRVASIEKRREFYTDHPRFGLRDVRVAELEGQLVGSLVLYPFQMYVRGQQLPVIGVGSVAVSPEHRRRGVGEACLRAALRELRQRGQHLSILYPFRSSYYRRLGYGVIEYVHQLAMAPANLPLSDEARRVRRLMLPDRSATEALYDRVAQQGHFTLLRKPDWWSRRLWGYPGDWVVYEGRRRGQIEGYLYYEVENSRPGAETGPSPHTGGGASGPRLRTTDVKGALERRPPAGDGRGALVLEVEDPILPLNSRSWRVKMVDGRLRVAAEPSRRLPRLTTSPDALAQLYAGTLSAARAAEVGLVDSTGGAAEIADHWFRARPAFLYQFNAF